MPILGYPTISAQERGATRSCGTGGAAGAQGKAVPVRCEAEQGQQPLGWCFGAGWEQRPLWALGAEHGTGLELLLPRGVCVPGRNWDKAVLGEGWAMAPPAGPELLGGSTCYFDQMIGFA